MKKIQQTFMVTLLIVCTLVAAGCTSSATTGTQSSSIPSTTIIPATPQESLIVYSGAGLKAPMQEIGQVFTKETGIEVQYNFAGSGTHISQMNLTKKGDIFITGSTVEFKKAQNQGLVGDYQLVGYHVPVIAVQKGNPKNITTIQNFAQPDLKIALGDVSATAIGKAGQKMFEKYHITDAVEQNVVTRAPTINELVIIMNTGQADAALLTLDQINEETMDAISIPTSDNVVLIIPVGVTTFTKDPESAQKFADFVASDEGKAIFVNHGFPRYPDPAYADVKP
ncbi:MAG: molybdate ABC transporter substrate-binding protein [Methanoregula sp.]|jgi:molybdate transport system substrate-binding protein|nr:molybdate ABC transporter substrate-binding protein [Methanoregula sp.]